MNNIYMIMGVNDEKCLLLGTAVSEVQAEQMRDDLERELGEVFEYKIIRTGILVEGFPSQESVKWQK